MFSASGSTLPASYRIAVFSAGSVRPACIWCVPGLPEVSGESNRFALGDRGRRCLFLLPDEPNQILV